MIVLFRIELFVLRVQVSRVHGCLVDDFAFEVDARGFDKRGDDVLRLLDLQVALLELVHIASGLGATVHDGIVHVVGQWHGDREIGSLFDDVEGVPGISDHDHEDRLAPGKADERPPNGHGVQFIARPYGQKRPFLNLIHRLFGDGHVIYISHNSLQI